MPPASRRPAAAPEPVDLATATAVLALGPEDFLAERVVAEVLAAARAGDPTVERRDLDLSAHEARGSLVEALSPDLFGTAAVVVCRGAESAEVGVVDELVERVGAGLSDVRLVVLHPGGQKGRQVADRLGKAGLSVVPCDRPKGRALDELVSAQARRNGRRLSADAAGALRTAVGDDLRSLASAVDQLCSDVVEDPIEAEHVGRYYDGVADMPGYLVSDAVLDGRTVEVLRRTRWALLNDPGAGPALTSSVASGVRQLARYTSAPRGLPDAELARVVGAPPFKLRSLRDQAQRWHPAALARAVVRLAVADAAVKGRDATGRQPEDEGVDRDQATFQLERSLLDTVRSRGATPD